MLDKLGININFFVKRVIYDVVIFKSCVKKADIKAEAIFF